jgi:hypothetical protein
MISLTEERITNISLTEALKSTGPKNLELTHKIILERNLISTIRSRVRISELSKKIGQLKKIEEYNQKKDRRNTTSIEMIM